jgi:NADPH:quinone reductase-like Zn-dependent oxidoreductase
MKAAWYEQQGPPSEVFVIGDMATPEPASGEVRISVATHIINHRRNYGKCNCNQSLRNKKRQ